MSRRLFLSVSLALCLFAVCAVESHALCNGSPFNPLTDVAWNGIFPIRVGGVVVAGSGLPDGSQGTTSPICTCTTSTESYAGLTIGFWDIDYLVEVVNDAWCSPTLGASLGGSLSNGFHNGQNDQRHVAPITFKQTHWLTFPLFLMIGMLTDMKCIQQVGFDFANFTELPQGWNNDLTSALKDPKVFLVANPLAEIACAGSNSLAQVPGGAFPIVFDAFWWCWWDNIYPVSGNVASPHVLTSAAQAASKQIFLNSEFGAVLDWVADPMGCNPQPAYIAKKSQWRLQLAKPVKQGVPMWIGLSEMAWGTGKSRPYYDSNFMFVLFQKKNCCQKILGSSSVGGGS